MKDEQGDRCPYYGHLSPDPLGERRFRYLGLGAEAELGTGNPEIQGNAMWA